MYDGMLKFVGQRQIFGLVMEIFDHDRMSDMVLCNLGKKLINFRPLVMIGVLNVFGI